MHTVKLTKLEAQEVLHKLSVVQDSDDLMEDYAVTAEQMEVLIASIPHVGGDWSFPEYHAKMIREEMADACLILRNQASEYDDKGNRCISRAAFASRLERKFA